MMTAEEWIKKNKGVEMPKGQINGGWFVANGLPMIVECQCCGSTMALPSAMVNEEGDVFCKSCVGED